MSEIKLACGNISFKKYLSITSVFTKLTNKESELLELLYEANPTRITTDSRDKAYALSSYSSKAVMNNVIKSMRDKGVIDKDNNFHNIILSYDEDLTSIRFVFNGRTNN